MGGYGVAYDTYYNTFLMLHANNVYYINLKYNKLFGYYKLYIKVLRYKIDMQGY